MQCHFKAFGQLSWREDSVIDNRFLHAPEFGTGCARLSGRRRMYRISRSTTGFPPSGIDAGLAHRRHSPSGKASMFRVKPGFGLFRRFSGIRNRVFHSLSISERPSGQAKAVRSQGCDRPIDSFRAWRIAAKRDPHGHQASAVLSSHMRRSRSKAFVVTTNFRMTAVTATLWCLPLSLSRP